MEREEIKIINLTEKEKLVLLETLGYAVDKEGYIIDAKTEERVIDRYSEVPVKFQNASILPGSTIIVDTNPFSFSEYLEDPNVNR